MDALAVLIILLALLYEGRRQARCARDSRAAAQKNVWTRRSPATFRSVDASELPPSTQKLDSPCP